MAQGPDNVRLLTTRRKAAVRLSALTSVALLLIGGVVGYSLALPGTEAAPSPTTVTSAGEVTQSAVIDAPIEQATASYDWLEQQRSASAQQAWGLFGAVEVDDAMYLLVFSNIDAPTDRVLWRSENGTDWTEISLDLGEEVAIHDLDVHDGALLLSGWKDEQPTIWRTRGRLGVELQWDEQPLPAAVPRLGSVAAGESEVTTVINEAGEVVVAVSARLEITDVLLRIADDPDVRSLRHLDAMPDFATSGQRLWARVMVDGVERVHTEIVPPTAQLDADSGSYATGMGQVVARSLWASTDGGTFRAIDVASLPSVPLPLPWGDNFVGTVESGDGSAALWISADGVTWRPTETKPPAACGDWRRARIAGSSLLVTSEQFDTMCVTTDGRDWTVRDSPATAISSTGQVWVEGGESGFLALAIKSPELAVFVSDDGLDWRRVLFGDGMQGTHALRVGNKLVTSAMTLVESPPGRTFRVWVGVPQLS